MDSVVDDVSLSAVASAVHKQATWLLPHNKIENVHGGDDGGGGEVVVAAAAGDADFTVISQ